MGMLAAADRARIERLLSIATATRPLPAPDGVLYFASDRGGHSQAYTQTAPGIEPKLVFSSGTRMVPHALTPLGLLVREDSGGNEIWQLGLISNGQYRRLTEDAKAVHQSVILAPDSKRVGLGWNPGGQANMQLGELDVASGALTAWAEPGGYWSWGAWSPDGKQAVVTKRMGTPAESYLLKRAGAMTRLLPSAMRVLPVDWSEHGILVQTDLQRDFLGLALVDPRQPEVVSKWLFNEDHDVDGAAVDPDNTKVAAVINDGIYDRISIIDMDGKVTRATLPPGVVNYDHAGDQDYHVGWSEDGKHLFASWERPTQPPEIYECISGTRWTFTNDLPPDLVEPVETSFTSFDGLTVQSVFYKIDDAPRPTVVYFHGGPEGQSRAAYLPAAQLLTSIGINVLLPNVRGSTGYGIRFQSLDDKTLRWNGVKDGCAAARYLKSSGLATRTAAMGGSYGGFMTLAVLVEDPDLWDAGVDTVGIADWHTFFRNMPPWRGVLRMTEYGDPNGPEADFLREISPIHCAGAITAPLLVIHGRNDPRVPVGESIQIAEAVKQSELLVLDDEGHGIVKLQNQVTANGKILEFLAANLL